jgi:hypothetical protein
MVDGYEISWQKITFPLRSALFFLLFFLFIYLWVDTKLIYFHQEQYLFKHIYVSSMHLFSDTPLFPGKPIEYVCAILSHYFYYSWAGAVIVTAIGWLLCLVTDSVIAVWHAHNDFSKRQSLSDKYSNQRIAGQSRLFVMASER